MLIKPLLGCLALATAAALPARADFTLHLIASAPAASPLVLRRGDTFTLKAVLTSTSADQINSAIFRLEFSVAGVIYRGYTWTPPFVNATLDDDSKPLATALPMALTAGVLSGAGYPAGVVDVELSNVIDSQLRFSSGTLVELDFAIPESFPLGPVSIKAIPDTFANGFAVVPTAAGAGVQIQVSDVTDGVRITGIAPSPGSMTITWTGGTGPFVVETKRALSDTVWRIAASTGGTSATIPVNAPSAFFRIRDGATNLRITDIAASGTNVVLQWSGGVGPFIIQSRAKLGVSSWQTVSTTGERSATLPMTFRSELFRVGDSGTNLGQQ